MNGQWGTFCSMTIASANVACVQMGYAYSGSWMPYSLADDKTRSFIPRASDTPIIIAEILCGYDNRRISPVEVLQRNLSSQPGQLFP